MVKVVSAVKLDSSEIKAIGEALKDTNVENQVDATLLGGLRITAKGKTTDMSLRTKLNQLRDTLTHEN